MAAKFTLLDSGHSEVATLNTLATNSFTPGANKLILAVINASDAVSNPGVGTASGNSLTWVSITSLSWQTATSTLQVFRARGGSPTTGALTFTFANTPGFWNWAIYEVDYVDGTGTNGSGAVVQATTASGSSTTPSTTLAAFKKTTNATFEAILSTVSGTAPTVGAGFTSDVTTNNGVSGDSMRIGYRLDSDTSVDGTTGSGAWGIIGIELNASPQMFGQSQADIKAVSFGYGQTQADIKAVGNGFGQAQAFIAYNTVADTFTRSVSSDWGTADRGGPYSSNALGTQYSVDGTEGLQVATVASQTRRFFLPEVRIGDTSVVVRVATDKLAVGTSLEAQVTVRQLNIDNEYYVLVADFTTSQTVQLAISKRIGGVQSAVVAGLTVARETHAANTFYWIRFDATGGNPTTLQAKIWRQGTDEPSAWDISGTDSVATLLQDKGSIGFRSFTGASSNLPNTYYFDDITTLRGQGFGQSQADIKAVNRGFAQSQADIKAIGQGFAQSQADIKAVGRGFGQSQADIKATSFGFAQSQADIKATSNAFAQSQADIKAVGDGFAQSQADIKAVGFGFGQSQSDIKAVANSFGQTQADIKQTYPHPISANSLVFDQFTRTLSGSWGSAPTGGAYTLSLGTAADFTTTGTLGKTTHNADNDPHRAMLLNVSLRDFNAVVRLFAVSANNNVAVLPNGALVTASMIVRYIDANNYYVVNAIMDTSAVTISLGIQSVVGGVVVDLVSPTIATNINSTFASRLFNLRVEVANINPTIISAKIFDAGVGESPDWLVIATDSSAELQVAGAFGVQSTTATGITNYPVVFNWDNFFAGEPLTGPFGQAQADIKSISNGFGQSQADVKATSNAFAQSQADIQQTYQGYGQSQSDIQATSNGFGQSQADINSTSFGFAQSQADINATSNGFGQSQADINAVSNGFGQSQADINAVGNGFGQSQADINASSQGYGQSQCEVTTGSGTREVAFGQSQATIKATSVGCGQSQADIRATSNGYGQSQADILATSNGFGQSQSDIKSVGYGFGQSKADIKAMSYAFGQSQADIDNTYFGAGQSQASIKGSPMQSGQSQVSIKATYAAPGQAQADIKATSATFGQSQARILLANQQGYGQSQATIRGNAFGQSQGWIKTTVNQYGNAQALIRTTVISTGQSNALIVTINKVYGQSQASILAKYRQFGQSQARIILSGVTALGQSQAFISKSAGYGQSQTRVFQKHFMKSLRLVDRSYTLRLVDREIGQVTEADNTLQLILSDRSLGLTLTDRLMTISLTDKNFEG